MYKHKLAATYHCNKKHHRKRWQWKKSVFTMWSCLFCSQVEFCTSWKRYIIWKEAIEQHKDYSFYNLIKKYVVHVRKVFKDFKGIKGYWKEEKKVSEFVLLRKRIKQFHLYHGMEDLQWKLYNFPQENQVVLPH